MPTLTEAKDTVRDLSTKMLHLVEDTKVSMSEKAESLKAYQADLEKAQAEVKDLTYVSEQEKMLRGLGAGNDVTEEKKTTEQADTRVKSVGEQFVEQISGLRSQLGGSFAGKRFSTGQAELKATISEGTAGTPGPGYAAIQTPTVLPGLVDIKRLPLSIADLFPQGSTDSPLLRYVVQAGYTNAAAYTSEGALKPEGSQNLTVVDETLHKITETYHVTDEMMEDFAQLQSFLNAQLIWDVKTAEEIGLLSGNGTAPNILGLLNRSGLSTTFAARSNTANGLGTTSATTDNDMDAIYRMITQLRVNSFIEPDHIVVDAASWQTVALTKSTQGVYYAGGPFMNAGNPHLWGLPVVVTPRMPAGTAVVGNFAVGGQIFRKGGITVEATNSNNDDFVKNLVTIRAEERLLLAVYRPNAFGIVTAL
jgi:HK97 family phage major capsid protein